jgi:hypothetical protein
LFGRMMPWGAGALTLLLVHGVCASRTAWAGCNHLVSSKSDRGFDFNRLDAIITGGSSFADDPAHDPSNEDGSNSPMPCSGPGCSSRVPMPVPTASAGPQSTIQWVVLHAVAPIMVAAPRRHTVEGPVARPDGHKPSIFHPPPA